MQERQNDEWENWKRLLGRRALEEEQVVREDVSVPLSAFFCPFPPWAAVRRLLFHRSPANWSGLKSTAAQGKKQRPGGSKVRLEIKASS